MLDGWLELFSWEEALTKDKDKVLCGANRREIKIWVAQAHSHKVH